MVVDKMISLVGALERQPVSVVLLERTGLSALLQHRIWAKLPVKDWTRVQSVMQTWMTFWREQ